MIPKDLQNRLLNARDHTHAILRSLRIDRILFFMCDCLMAGEKAYLEQRSNAKELFLYTYNQFCSHLKKLLAAWNEWESIYEEINALSNQ